MSAVCCVRDGMYLVQLHHDSQVIGESGFLELREGFGSLRWVQGWYQHGVIKCYRCLSVSSGARGLGVTSERY